MNLIPYALVLLSTITHAYWNFLIKRSNGTQVFIGLSKLVEIVIFAPVFIYFARPNVELLAARWPLYTVGALLVVLNYAFLGLAYFRGSLSSVYPISRAGILLFLPFLAYGFLGERIDPIGAIALLVIVVGVFSMQIDNLAWTDLKRQLSSITDPAVSLALLAALSAACYTLWDKRSVASLPPFLYFYSYTALAGVTYAAAISVKNPWESIREQWSKNRGPIIQVGVLNTFTYLLVLYSLQSGKSSYVIALRQLSIAVGVALGVWFLGESLTKGKKLGVGLLLTGSLLISVAR